MLHQGPELSPVVLARAAVRQRPPQADGTGKEPGSYGAWTCGQGLIPMAFEKWSQP